MSGPVMMCGHAAQGKRQSDGAWVCAICSPRNGYDQPQDPEAVAQATAGRMMRCSYHHGRDGRPCPNHDQPQASRPDAPFFYSKPHAEFDEFYDGCWGWD